MFKSALICLLLTFTFSNAQFIPASTGGFYDLRGSPTALPGLSATGIELSITGVESEHKINYFRPMQRRLLEVSTFEPIPCKEGSNSTDCVCPGKCLAYAETNDGKSGCFPNDCWKWDDVNDNCVKEGKPFVPAIVLQGIPFTGAFGSGWGNIGRWDLFAVYMGTVFGGLVFICIMSCCIMSGGEDCKDCGLCAGYCFALLWAIAIVALWIWGIVEIANKPDAPWTNWKGEAIMCPLVEG